MHDDDGNLKCDMRAECQESVAYIDDKGFVYCQQHGLERQHYRKCRKLRPYELRRLQRGLQVMRY